MWSAAQETKRTACSKRQKLKEKKKRNPELTLCWPLETFRKMKRASAEVREKKTERLSFRTEKSNSQRQKAAENLEDKDVKVK